MNDSIEKGNGCVRHCMRQQLGGWISLALIAIAIGFVFGGPLGIALAIAIFGLEFVQALRNCRAKCG